jgi:hypothetical protein
VWYHHSVQDGTENGTAAKTCDGSKYGVATGTRTEKIMAFHFCKNEEENGFTAKTRYQVEDGITAKARYQVKVGIAACTKTEQIMACHFC